LEPRHGTPPTISRHLADLLLGTICWLLAAVVLVYLVDPATTGNTAAVLGWIASRQQRLLPRPSLS
jgi:hypothetical protein